MGLRSVLRGRATRAIAVLLLVGGGAGLAIAAQRDGHDATIEANELSTDAAGTLSKCGRDERALGGGVLPIESADGVTVVESGPVDKSGLAAEMQDGDTPRKWVAQVRSPEARTSPKTKLRSAERGGPAL